MSWRGAAVATMDADDIDLIARIYDTALDPSVWPELMLRIAHKLGARGAFIFDLRLDHARQQIGSRIFSANYVPEIVHDYMIRFNDYEIKDQHRFAQLSQIGDTVDLISDVELQTNLSDLLAQPNTAFMMTHGLKHRAGALLNKDLINVDRFALQYPYEHGPITKDEIKQAALFMPHIAKVIGLSRPLEAQLVIPGVFEDLLRDIGHGVAVLSPRGTILYANTEFERCITEHHVFRKAPNGVLQLEQHKNNNQLGKRFNDMVTNHEAHGNFGARARKEAVIIELEKTGTALFIEICPVQASKRTGNLGEGCRLMTIIDTSRAVHFDTQQLTAFYQLSASEVEVLKLVAQGYSNAEISDMRNRSQDTIKSQLKSLMLKTNSQSRTDLVHMIHNLSSVIGYKNAR